MTKTIKHLIKELVEYMNYKRKLRHFKRIFKKGLIVQRCDMSFSCVYDDNAECNGCGACDDETINDDDGEAEGLKEQQEEERLERLEKIRRL